MEGFKLKHGRGDEMNHDIAEDEDIELEAYAVDRKKGFNTEKVPASKKMAYSSQHELDSKGEDVKGRKGDYE